MVVSAHLANFMHIKSTPQSLKVKDQLGRCQLTNELALFITCKKFALQLIA